MPRGTAALAALVAAAATAGLLALTGAGSSARGAATPEAAMEGRESRLEAPEREEIPDEPGVERLRAPRPPGSVAPLTRGATPDGFTATAYHFKAPVYERARDGAEIVGWVRRGRRLPAESRRGSCRGGSWYAVPGGFVCTGDGFHVGSREGALELDRQPVREADPLPYRYALVRRGAARFYRVPTDAEQAALATHLADPSAAPAPEVVHEVLNGDYFIALDERPEADPGEGWVRTLKGRVLAAADVTVQATPSLVGARPDAGDRAPRAFAYGELERPLFRIDDGEAREVGVAEKHARLVVAEERSVAGKTYVVDAEGRALLREHVRVARAIDRPERVPADVRWVHVDLAEQTMVAYEGDQPVLMTLVSSGREGYATVKGTFQVREKYLSTTMTGADPVDGPYEVDQVPWTQYFWQSYALHGAYWHDDFGVVRSHGCVNVAPHDARFLFEFTKPELPDQWHGRRRVRGTWVHLTR
ncbi:MAG: L,D-transpeptidase [Myxococcota bacterium]